MRLAVGAALAAMALAGPAAAAVVGAGDSGFRIENRAAVATTADRAWTALGEIGRWWNDAHTYSGSASNMTIEMKPGGCWCEALPGGGVEHGRVILVWPEQRMLRIEGALGPLQDEGVTGALTWQVKETTDGVEIVQTYHVGGVRPEMAKNAALIDAVMAEQLKGLGAYLSPSR